MERGSSIQADFWPVSIRVLGNCSQTIRSSGSVDSNPISFGCQSGPANAHTIDVRHRLKLSSQMRMCSMSEGMSRRWQTFTPDTL